MTSASNTLRQKVDAAVLACTGELFNSNCLISLVIKKMELGYTVHMQPRGVRLNPVMYSLHMRITS